MAYNGNAIPLGYRLILSDIVRELITNFSNAEKRRDMDSLFGSMPVYFPLPGPGAESSAPSYDYSELLGQRAVLDPGGENPVLDELLPQSGVLNRQLALQDWGSDWLVLDFEEPFEYAGVQIAYCLIRARWQGTPIGSGFCSAFVLMDRDGALAAQDQWRSADFQFVSWGFVRLEESA